MTRAQALLTLTVCLTPSAAAAQEPAPTLTLAPARAARWDVVAHVTWAGEHRAAATSFESGRWFGVASGGGSAGFYWTPHLKTEVDLVTSSEGEYDVFEAVAVPGGTIPVFVQRNHAVRFTTAGAGLVGQFFENAWFHPFVSAGLELVRERERIETVSGSIPPRGPTIAPAADTDTRARYDARPYTAAGFKVYVSDHAFIRTDIRTSWSRDGLAALGWRSGVGVDF